VRVLTQTQRQALTIPASALERGPEGMFTYLVQPDSTIAVAPLSVGAQNGNIVVVETGLAAGQRVVASNQYRLQPGSLVRANPPGEGGPKLAKRGGPGATGERAP